MKPPPSNAFLADPAPPATLAVFGKHPLAADHLEDIGLSTASLVNFKQGMYIEGIGDCLKRQTWLKDLGSLDSVPYDHHMLCLGSAGWLAARLVHSSDAAGRKQYPLVLALHSGDFALLHQIGNVVATLESTLEPLRTASDTPGLRQALASGTQRLTAFAEKPVPSPGAQARESWLQHMPSAGPDRVGLWRCCHALRPDGAAAGRARIPLHPTSPWPSAALWSSFFFSLLGDKSQSPITLIWRHGQAFADAWLSPPGGRVLTTLFTDEAAQPLTTDVPFSIPPELRRDAEFLLNTWLQQPELFPSPVENVENSILNKVCKGMFGWLKPS